MKKIILLVIFLIIVFTLGKELLPSDKAFDYHDVTQPARVKEFTFNLKNGQIPPRIAPNFSFNLGYPVFNFYAPTAYWITSGINLLGIDPINSIKVSFLLTLIIAFLGMYFLANELIDFPGGIIAGSLLASSPWMAVQIFVRGDLAEAWFIALFPLTLFFLKKNSQKKSGRFWFLGTIIITSLLLTSHNLLSLIGLGIIIVYILLINKNLLKNFISLIISFLLASYFFLPAFLELNFTHAVKIASETSPYSNFLCLNQIWTGSWGYGGSVDGCENDGMAFIIGKLMIILTVLGLIWGLINYKKIKNKNLFIYLTFLSFISIFMTLEESKLIWKIGEPYSKIFQFPWRFLDITIIAFSLIAGYIIINNKNILLKIGLMILIIVNIFYNTKFFTKPSINLKKLTNEILSPEYIKTSVVYDVPEYLPKTASIQEWFEYKTNSYFDQKAVVSKEFLPVKNIKDTFFYKESKTLLRGSYLINIHYLPYWKIYINNKPFIPKKLDQLGRPLINLTTPATIKIIYKQTLIEQIGNLITLITLISLFVISINKKLWKKMKI